MSHDLSTYLHDHLAGSTLALELLEHLRTLHSSDFIGAFATELLLDIETDRTSLQQIAVRIGQPSNAVKEAAAWLGEKVARLKLSDAGTISFGTFETLEFLELGIQGKAALWRALEAASTSDIRLQATDFPYLINRAEDQAARVEKQRLELARTVFEEEKKRKGAPRLSLSSRQRRAVWADEGSLFDLDFLPGLPSKRDPSSLRSSGFRCEPVSFTASRREARSPQ